VEHALATLQWKDAARDRRALLEYVERLALEERESARRNKAQGTLGQSLQSTFERGWYFGTEAFGEQLLEKASEAIGRKGKAKRNYHGAEMRDYGEAEARKIIAQRLLEGGLKSLDLITLPKGDARKIKIAKEVRTKTSVPLIFVARELSMGSPMNVSKLTNRK
jgi:hypothetical protein